MKCVWPTGISDVLVPFVDGVSVEEVHVGAVFILLCVLS